MKQLTVEVTQEDINNGITACDCCPIALAIKRAKGIEDGVSVFYAGILIEGVSGTIFQTPESKAFMHAFDEGKPVEPQTFVFEVPE